MIKHMPRKRFGQNFLHDQNVIHKIVSAIKPQTGDALVEIGPGKGALTEHLLTAAGEMDVIEIDRDLIPELEKNLEGRGNLTIHNVDALRFDFSALAATKTQKLKVVGNLPYNISTPLIFRLIKHIEHIQQMTFMLQKEVVDRMVAAPDSDDYGRLSVMVQYHCQADKLFNVGPNAFWPRPKVDSAVVRLTPRKFTDVELNDYSVFAEIVNKCFTQRRKTLRNILKNYVSAEAMSAINIDPQRRPETLTLAEFVRIANLVK